MRPSVHARAWLHQNNERSGIYVAVFVIVYIYMSIIHLLKIFADYFGEKLL